MKTTLAKEDLMNNEWLTYVCIFEAVGNLSVVSVSCGNSNEAAVKAFNAVAGLQGRHKSYVSFKDEEPGYYYDYEAGDTQIRVFDPRECGSKIAYKYAWRMMDEMT